MQFIVQHLAKLTTSAKRHDEQMSGLQALAPKHGEQIARLEACGPFASAFRGESMTVDGSLRPLDGQD
jgi:hypothetical protein